MDCHLAATLKSLRRNILVIGYGNPLRCDDGVGQLVAQAVAAWELPYVRAIAVHQLTPELVELLAATDMAIFIDAYPATATETIQIRPLKPAESGIASGHWCEPQVLLAMTQALYGNYPQAWWAIVPGVNFDLGDYISPIAQQGMETALEEIRKLIS